MKPKIRMLLPLANSEEELEELQKQFPKLEPRGGMVVWVEGRKCVKIPLTRNLFTVIDESDYSSVGDVRWCAYVSHGLRYAVTRTANQIIRMHCLILGHPNELIDHKNMNGLDNRRKNLRLTGRGGNSRNSKRSITNKSGFKGVSEVRRTGKWVAKIGFEGQQIYLGIFEKKEDAAKAYDAAAISLDREFFRLNYPTTRTPNSNGTTTK